MSNWQDDMPSVLREPHFWALVIVGLAVFTALVRLVS